MRRRSSTPGGDSAAGYVMALLGLVFFFVMPFFASLKSFYEGDVMMGIYTFVTWFAVLGLTAVAVRI